MDDPRKGKRFMGNLTHGMCDTPFCRVFYSIRNRCNNKGCSNYSYYGGRGIKCLWNTFEDFRDDMYISYINHVNQYGSRDTTIDRKNINEHYCKENCHWATRLEQGSNKRNNHKVTYNGETKTLAEWSRILNIPRERIRDRLDAGWSIKEAMETPRLKNQFDKGFLLDS